jgi:hypothetical protein
MLVYKPVLTRNLSVLLKAAQLKKSAKERPAS